MAGLFDLCCADERHANPRDTNPRDTNTRDTSPRAGQSGWLVSALSGGLAAQSLSLHLQVNNSSEHRLQAIAGPKA